MIIRGTTSLLGLIGYPVNHSLSPVMHNAAIAHLGVDAVYLPFAVEPSRLGEAIAGLAAIGVQGFNVTIPHKQAVIPYLYEVSAAARAIGAVNTIYRLPSGAWGGTNTDVNGFIDPLLGQDWQGKEAVILGTGGAARAAIAGCQQLGLKVSVVGRSDTALQTLATDFGITPCMWGDQHTLLQTAALCVNTTPVGMKDPDQSPLAIADVALLPATAWVYDLIYTPRPTRLLQMAAARGLATHDGLRMLVVQGAAALGVWLHRDDPPVAVMQAAAEAALS